LVRMINPLNPKEVKQLQDSMAWSRKKLAPFRRNRMEILREYVGFHYSDNGAYDRVPINLMELALNIYQQLLAAQAPRVLITSPYKPLKPKAADFQLGMNHLLEEIQFGKTIATIVLDALIGMGIGKTAINNSATIEIGGFLHDVAQPFTDAIHLDDWVHDMTAKVYEQVQYAGNRYTLLYDEAMEMFKASKAREHLTPSETRGYNEGGEPKGETLSRGAATSREEFRKTVEVWDIWLPKEGFVLTMQAGDGSSVEGEVLNVVEWEGPEIGPYQILSFNDVPGNIMPLPPAALWEDLHDLENRLYRKLGRQAERQKTILGVRSGGNADGQRVIKANDGEAINLDDPRNTQEYKFGGIDNTTLAFLIQSKDLYSYLAGNLDALGGLSPQAETLGQDRLLAASASQRILKMQKTTIEFTTQVIKSLGFYLWYDPWIRLPLVKRAPGGIEIPITFTPEDREGDFLDYNIKIEPYSMQHHSPASKLQAIREIFSNFIAPFLPMLEAQGITVDFEALFKTIGNYANLTELKDFLIYTNPHEPEKMPVQPGRQAPVTRRINERVNRPGATTQGKDAALIQMLLGGRVQPAEAASIPRAVG